MMKLSNWKFALAGLLFILVLPVQAQEGESAMGVDLSQAEAGYKIFTGKGNCYTCHKVHAKLVGPALKNVWERVPQPAVEYLTGFIKYPARTMQGPDATDYAKALWAEYDPNMMPNHDFLTDDEIKQILAFIEVKTNDPGYKELKKDTTVAKTTGGGESSDSGPMTTILFVLIGVQAVVLAVIALLLGQLMGMLKGKEDISETDKEYLNQKIKLWDIVTSRPFVGTVSFIFVAVVLKAVVDGLFAVGIQQGYAPEQPIPFSHKLHAGHYEIECVYCHTGVEKSKSANIPSANICMNCHNQLRQGSPYINKIYEALENNQPIQWVRVHNLPDLAYFNHSQHVKVAGIECQDCHGEIEKMEVVQQHSMLTMGWCIACHRQYEVNGKDNAYYDNMMKIHELKSGEPLNVEGIGGLECSKCHY